MISKLNREERRLLRELMTYDVNQGILNTYRYKVRHNKHDTYEICKKKLIRNIILGIRKESLIYNNTMFAEYGNLVITYNTKKKEITYIENRVGNFGFEPDVKKKEYLNRKLGLVGTGDKSKSLFNRFLNKKVVG